MIVAHTLYLGCRGGQALPLSNKGRESLRRSSGRRTWLKTIGIGIIGSGGIAQGAHMPGYKALEGDGVRIVAVADAMAATAKSAADKFDVPHQFTDYKQLL